MLDNDATDGTATASTGGSAPSKRRAAGRPAGPPAPTVDIFAVPGASHPATDEPATDRPATDRSEAGRSTRSRPRAETAEAGTAEAGTAEADRPAPEEPGTPEEQPGETATPDPGDTESRGKDATGPMVGAAAGAAAAGAAAAGAAAMFQPPATTVLPARSGSVPTSDEADTEDPDTEDPDTEDPNDDSGPNESGDAPRRRRRRGGRRRRKGDGTENTEGSHESESGSVGEDGQDDNGDDGSGGNGSARRRRRRARSGEDAAGSADDPANTVVKVRDGRTAADEIASVSGSTRLEAKKQRRREGREAGRRRAPIVSEAEFLARRESVTREMVVRQHGEHTQIAVVEDGVLVEHYVARDSQTSMIGNVYLGTVQNVLPSMEAAFVDIGAGRNAVIYAGEVDWSGVEGGSKKRAIEEALSPGQSVLVQVTKDPVGQKGARLTSQISLPGRFLVYVPQGQASGISRKLPDTERARLKGLLKEVLPDDASVIVRTAAEGASEEQLTRDVNALRARWDDISAKIESGAAPLRLYAEPDLVIKVVRDLFNEDFASLVVQGADAWDNISGYVSHVAPDLADRAGRWEPGDDQPADVFAARRLDEQVRKALERKVWLPSGGSLIIDRTEAMTVIDVNTGKFTGSGGNLEETVTKNNLEAAEEIVRQLRLRDIGGIIVIDFIDMVMETNRELVLRRLVECLGRDRTRHQVAEVTSLGLVQMTRKRIGTGLLESFSQSCEHCAGRGVVLTEEPVEPPKESRRPRRGGRGGKGESKSGGAKRKRSSSSDASTASHDPGTGDAGAQTAADTPAEASEPAADPEESPQRSPD